MKPFFSVIIPALNEEVHLPKLLQDLSKQSTKNFEVIVVDGKSEDSTIKQASTFKNRLDLSVITADKQNVSYQRNTGAAAARGSYLVFLDADMRIGKEFITALGRYVKDEQFLYIPYHKPDKPETQDKVIHKMMRVFTEISQHTHKPFTFGPGLIINRDFFYNLGGYDEKIFAEDQEIIQRAKEQGQTARILSKVIVKYSIRRFTREGRVKVLGTYFKVLVHMLTKGNVKKELIKYEMGGNL